MDWYGRERATELLAIELKKRGWNVEGYHPTESDPMTDYYSMGFWRGKAVNAKFPSIEIVCNTSEVPKGKMIAIFNGGRLILSLTGFTQIYKEENAERYVNSLEEYITKRKTPMTIKSPDEPATQKQLWYLHILTRKDTRGLNITKGEASKLIEEIKRGMNVDIEKYRKVE